MRAWKAIRRWTLWFAFLVYCGFAVAPAELWFNPGVPEFLDTEQGQAPELRFPREVRVSTTISYSTVTRVIVDGELGDTVCEGDNGNGFPYREVDGWLLGKDLTWWSDGDERCGNLPPGLYQTKTEWSIRRPLDPFLPSWLKFIGWIVPPKPIHRVSPPFEVIAGNSERRG
jgi:hypothetical protein